ncbi:EAL domain-containing protein [Dermatophilus congolensis]|uniref:EAL domain-containing protein n=1 Tax=Dermatophilus congolensis TaxID=1863 RepID=UPI001AAF81F5|nr:EAL domain-containing protein [Dermatophilus congolensis]MBO3160497.1 EAL domain-containing protein [Dermatophilus congolensis]MBO3177324.1 EAL domain-containing protein [Dermatophilus congolensis]MBO3184094.1 EAL domain-containing protein [Dermatophilus congolensis]MBO3201062.1 EAL domain-containing protein [Dermatophilus congolensis]
MTYPITGKTTPPHNRCAEHSVLTGLVVVAVVLYLVLPSDLATPVKNAWIILCGIIAVFSPLAKRLRKKRLWAQVPIGLCFYLYTMIDRGNGHTIGPFQVSDGTYIAGYVILCIWLTSLNAQVVGKHLALRVFLDTAASTSAAVLALWTFAVTVVPTHSLPPSLIWTAYPILDIIALSQATHLTYRSSGSPSAWRWLLPAFVLLFITDVAYVLLTVFQAQDGIEPIAVNYMIAAYFLAVGGHHPSIRGLHQPPAPQETRSTQFIRISLIFTAVLLAVISLAFPVHRHEDEVARSGLIAFLLIALFARLLMTMSDLAHAEQESRNRATYDALTGLVSRQEFIDRLHHRLMSDHHDGLHTALLFIDCDDFKLVNDTWGHAAGDSLLREVALRLRNGIHGDRVLGRLGGDEFVIAISLSDPTEASDLAHTVQALFNEPIPVLPHHLHNVRISLGVATTATTSAIHPDLLSMADAALYEAKARGRAQFVVYDEELDQAIHQRNALATSLRQAIKHDNLTITYQEIRTGPGYTRIAGWEALARWHHPTLGDIPPAVFIPLAEELGLINALGHTVLLRACREFATLRTSLDRADTFISINVSAPQLHEPGFTTSVLDALNLAGLSPKDLKLEITETMIVTEESPAVETLTTLRTAGIRICMDDFGTGYASLATLIRLPLDTVKLDQSITARLQHDPQAPAQATAILDLARSLLIADIVAEGVETAEQAALLESIGCPMIQGWLYGHPQSLTDIIASEKHQKPTSDRQT